jgi:hypothetical protein
MAEKTDNHQEPSPPLDTLVDFVTGRVVPDIGTESHRQKIEHFLVAQRGYAKSDIAVDAEIVVVFPEEIYRSQLDLVVWVDGRSFMVIKCAAGALESWQREVLSAARIYPSGPIPCAAVTDGETAVVYDSRTGKKLGEGLAAIPDIRAARTIVSSAAPIDIPEKRLEKERIIFRSYDSMNIHVQRRMIAPSHNPGK